MDDRYLWDGTGPVDPEVERLEREMGRFRHQRPALRLPEPQRRRLRPFLAAAAAILAATAATWVARSGAAPRWRVESLQGTPVVGSMPVAQAMTLSIGQRVETDGSSRA